MEAENKQLKLDNQLLNGQYISQRQTQQDILKTLHNQLEENFSKLEEQEMTIKCATPPQSHSSSKLFQFCSYLACS